MINFNQVDKKSPNSKVETKVSTLIGKAPGNSGSTLGSTNGAIVPSNQAVKQYRSLKSQVRRQAQENCNLN